MSINETRREAIINKIKELERFLEPEGAHFVLHLGKISLKHHKENVEMMKLVDKLIESIQSGKELSTELEGDMIELLKALKAERNDAGSKKNLYN